ncbi:hypothetical protein DMENIID0001_103530 [Sergentomyia squamirostris]
MPCESCNAQFSVFKIKRSCSECRRLFCKQCLVKKKDRFLCERCVIFTTRPLSRVDLLQLKPKDLIFYCQSKHISTIGCVEKEELVDLVMAHGNASTPQSSGATPRQVNPPRDSNEDNCTNPFDQIRLTCQNFFSHVAERINTELNLDLKTSSSFSPRQSTTTSPPRATEQTQTSPIVQDVRSRMSSPHAEPFSSSYSSSSHPASSSNSLASEHSRRSTKVAPAPPPPVPVRTHSAAGHARSKSVDKTTKEELNDLHEFEIIQSSIDLTPDAVASTSAGGGSNLRRTPQTTVRVENSDSSSSFEELGAVGGSDSFSAVTNNDKSTSETLQISIDGQLTSSSEGVHENVRRENGGIFNNDRDGGIRNLISGSMFTRSQDGVSLMSVDSTPVHRSRRLVRRRSDSYVIETGMLERDISLMFEDESSRKRSRTSSQRSGRDKEVLKVKLEQFKSEMAALGLSDASVQQQLDAVLKYLEERKLSASLGPSTSSAVNVPIEDDDDDIRVLINDNDGIHVYAISDGIPVINVEKHPMPQVHNPRRYLRLDDIASSDDLEKLSVKQLKELLMLNRVDFKGCCEKNELLERVTRLWRDHRANPTAEKLPTDDLCKICMDAPIECVILECGHMATCTNCGKILHECPICRQYIVRVVRFFKA